MLDCIPCLLILSLFSFSQLTETLDQRIAVITYRLEAYLAGILDL